MFLIFLLYLRGCSSKLDNSIEKALLQISNAFLPINDGTYDIYTKSAGLKFVTFSSSIAISANPCAEEST